MPESELETSPDMKLPEKRPRKPRRKITDKPPESSPVEPAPDATPEEKPEEKPAEPDVEEVPGDEGKPDVVAPVRKPRRRKPTIEEGAPGETPVTEGSDASSEETETEGAEKGEELDDGKIQDISDSIKDIVSSIEKRESKKESAEKVDTKGGRTRTYCSVCHGIIATIHHACGAHLCSRCVIDFNKDRRAEKNLCPKCLKPIETSAPPSGSRAGWRDSL